MIFVKLVFYIAVVVASATIDKGAVNNIAPSEINAKYLIDLGIKTNDEKLQAVGMAMNNIHSNPCTEWTKWSVCSASFFRYFGIKQRNRTCSNETKTEFTLCRSRCPLSYSTTKHGYCIKEHNTLKSHFDAEKHCQTEGGHLVQIDSLLKYNDVINTGLAYYYSISGRRESTHSPWLFEDGSKIEFFKWGKSEPDNGSDKLCMHFLRAMHDVSCSSKANFICEIQV